MIDLKKIKVTCDFGEVRIKPDLPTLDEDGNFQPNGFITEWRDSFGRLVKRERSPPAFKIIYEKPKSFFNLF